MYEFHRLDCICNNKVSHITFFEFYFQRLECYHLTAQSASTKQYEWLRHLRDVTRSKAEWKSIMVEYGALSVMTIWMTQTVIALSVQGAGKSAIILPGETGSVGLRCAFIR